MLSCMMTEESTLQAEATQLAEAGDFPAAVKVLQRALALQPDLALLHELQAQCLMELEEHEAAYKSAQRATQLDPGWQAAQRTFARSARNCGHLTEAAQAFASLVEHLPGDLELTGELAEAESLLQQQTAARVGLPGLRITQAFNQRQGTGGMVWDAGVVLAKYLVHVVGKGLHGLNVLELGSGTGVAGITAACLGANVLLTDVSQSLPLLTHNVDQNELAVQQAGGRLQAAELDWRRPDTSVCSKETHLLLAADVVYAHRTIPELQKTVGCVLAANPDCAVLLAHKHRHDSVDTALLAALAETGLQLVCVGEAVEAHVKVYKHL